MQCSNGHDNVEGQHFCGTCGLLLAQVVAEQPPSVDTPALPVALPTMPDVPAAATAEIGAPVAKRRKKWLIVPAIVLVAAVAAGVAFTGGSSDDDGRTIHGVFTLTGSIGDVSGPWASCEGTGGYSDVGPGQNVSVLDADGTLIGSGMTQSVDRQLVERIAQLDRSSNQLGLADGSAGEEELVDLLDNMAQLEIGCMLYFEVDVPLSQFYQIEVGRRGELDYSLEQLSEKDFFVALTLGDIDL